MFAYDKWVFIFILLISPLLIAKSAMAKSAPPQEQKIFTTLSVTRNNPEYLQIPQENNVISDDLLLVESSPPPPQPSLDILPIGIKIGARDVLSGVLVKGAEDGSQAVNFEQWLVPYQSILKAFRFTETPMEDGSIQLRSPGLVTRFEPKFLIKDPDIGDALTIEEINRQLPVKVKFDIDSYALIFEGDWLEKTSRKQIEVTPVVLDGLPIVTPPDYAFSALSQNVNSAVANSGNLANNGSTTLGGKLGEFTFNTTISQPNFQDLRQAYLQSLKIQNLNKTTDHILGNQELFYPGSNNFGEFWGYTYIQRFGYESHIGGSAGDLNSRLINQDFVRTIQGTASEGTLVQLWQDSLLLGEYLVDKQKNYVFPNVKGNRFLIVSYPDGNLAATPQREIRILEPQYQQLPAGSSALFTSLGTWRNLNKGDFLGSFNGLVAGLGYRYGIWNDLTIGVGGFYDNKDLGFFGEVFYTNSDFPVALTLRAISPTANKPANILLTGNFKPSKDFTLAWSGNNQGSWQVQSNVQFSQKSKLQLSLNNSGLTTQASQFFSLLGISGNLSLGYQYSNSSRAFLETTMDWRQGDLALSWNSRLNSEGGWQLRNAVKWKNWQLGLTKSYKQFSRSRFYLPNSEIWNKLTIPYNSNGSFQDIYLINQVAKYRDGSVKDQIYARHLQPDHNSSLGVVAWHRNGNPASIPGQLNLTNWGWELGYGFGNQSSGLLMSVTSPNLFAGLRLQASYLGASFQNVPSGFSIGLNFNLNLNFQDGIARDTKNAGQFLESGGILVKTFYDLNNNGIQDKNESTFSENYKTLLKLNNKSLKDSKNLTLTSNGVLISTEPGKYRLDLDPSGYPINWEPQASAYAVQVAPGAYTVVKIPFVQTTTIEGIVRTQFGEPVNGARVEAININTNRTFFSITSPNGIFYLENLPFGEYQLKIGDLEINPRKLKINNLDSIPGNLELQVTAPVEEKPGTAKTVPNYRIDGYLQDENGEEVRGIKITAVNTKSGESFTAVTDIQGFFRFENLTLGNYRIQVSDFAVVPPDFTIDSSSKWDINLNFKVSVSKQELYSEAAGYIIRGKLQDKSGDSLHNLTVKLVDVKTNRQLSVKTNVLGAFTIENISLGKYEIVVTQENKKLITKPSYIEINEESYPESSINVKISM